MMLVCSVVALKRVFLIMYNYFGMVSPKSSCSSYDFWWPYWLSWCVGAALSEVLF